MYSISILKQHHKTLKPSQSCFEVQVSELYVLAAIVLRSWFALLPLRLMDHIQRILEHIDQAELWERNVSLKRGEYLKVKGSTDTKLYHIVGGSLRIFVDDGQDEHTIRFAYEGNFIAALDSFITNAPSDLYIQAIKATELRVISKDAYLKLMDGSEELRKIWQEVLSMIILQQMERERDLLTSSPLERYERVLKRSPQLFQEVPHKYIASYLRMTPETLSRIKKS